MCRIKLQKEAIKNTLINTCTVLQWATGIGKSKVAIEVADSLYKKNNNIKILLIVAEIAHKDNWQREIVKFNMEHLIENDIIIMNTYASLKKHKYLKYDFVILDEGHHIASDIRFNSLKTINITKLLVLSATIPTELVINIFKLFKGTKELYKISLKEAIEQKILPKPKIFLIPLTLDSNNYDNEIIEEWGKKEIRVSKICNYEDRFTYITNKLKYPNLKLIIKCTQKQKYEYINQKFKYWQTRFFNVSSIPNKNKYLKTGGDRKRFLGESKTTQVQYLLTLLKDKRYICFCTNIQQTKLLGIKNAIHSKQKESLNLIDSFNNETINNLFAVGMLQEGQNLVNIEAGIIIQLDGQERAFIQKFGRTLRAEDPIQFIFYYKNTRDEEYLKNIIEYIDMDYVHTIEDIKQFKL